MSGYAFGSFDELGDGYGFRKVRRALGVKAFGVNGIVMPPGFEGFLHFHEGRTSSTSFTAGERSWRSAASRARSEKAG